MSSFSSASQMCDPLPRTIKRGSPPTEPNARTGEFTPPGIMLSARCCKRRDCSVLRDVVDGIESSRPGNEFGAKDVNRIKTQPITIAAPRTPNSSDIHSFAILLQHASGTFNSSSCPSNREGFEDSLGGSGLSFLLSLNFSPRFATHLTHQVLLHLPVSLSTMPAIAIRLELRAHGRPDCLALSYSRKTWCRRNGGCL